MDPQPLFTRRTLDFWDEDSGYHFVAATPDGEPELWSQFLDGARAAYRRFDAEAALEYDSIRDGACTALFFAAVTTEGVVHGGSRALGPYGSGSESHAFLEWSDPEVRAEIARILDAYVPHGLLEVKSTWVEPDVPHRSQLSAGVARTLTYSMELLGTRYLVATSASTAVSRWQQSGAEVVDEIPPCPYPDDRYRTHLIVWDVERCRSERRSRELEKLLASEAAPGFTYMPAQLPLRSLERGDLKDSGGET
ncbi:hypothetical protein [Rhodococcus sp. B50]|uniref:hypothetical protein n=1 Tax=Rhodococcus sp. B50 TaxID=2682847 RepID=UPI001BD3F167|nr:hypothetical protein [Rhodococcus sp. B50]MBS9373473.1 hypothetical protein [Rhodococcus sp. B50]